MTEGDATAEEHPVGSGTAGQIPADPTRHAIKIGRTAPPKIGARI